MNKVLMEAAWIGKKKMRTDRGVEQVAIGAEFLFFDSFFQINFTISWIGIQKFSQREQYMRWSINMRKYCKIFIYNSEIIDNDKKIQVNGNYPFGDKCALKKIFIFMSVY